MAGGHQRKPEGRSRARRVARKAFWGDGDRPEVGGVTCWRLGLDRGN